MLPEHFSRDVVARCAALIRDVGPVIAGEPPHGPLPSARRHGGPLTTTFLLSMAMPMLLLPLERIYKPGTDRSRYQSSDDRHVDPRLAALVQDALGEGQLFSEAPFAAGTAWHHLPSVPAFPAGGGLGRHLLKDLGSDEAFQRAQDAGCKRALLDIRNALAHGGVHYLDHQGLQRQPEVNMLAFVSRNDTVASVWRVSQDDFRQFLLAWADWLGETGLSEALNAAA